VGEEEVGEDHEVVVDEVVLVVDYHHPHPVVLRILLRIEDRVLVVIVPVIAVPVWTFETMPVKATVKGVFTIVGAADVVVAEDSLAADVVTEVA
jgi:hypothetical protein